MSIIQPNPTVEGGGTAVKNVKTITCDANLTVTDRTGRVVEIDAIGGTFSGSIEDEEVAVGSATDTIAGDENFTWNSANKRLYLRTDSNSDSLRIICSDTDSSSGPQVMLRRDSNDSANGDDIGKLVFNGDDEDDNDTSYAQIAATIQKNTADHEAGGLVLNVRTDNVLEQFAKLEGTDTTSGAVFIVNNNGEDIDFRVEGQTGATGVSQITSLLRTDAANGRVGIGDASPSVPLHVSSPQTGSLMFLECTDTDAADGPQLTLLRSSATPAQYDDIGGINFRGKDSGANSMDYARIWTEIRDVTENQISGALILECRMDDTLREFIRLSGGSDGSDDDGYITINESGRDIDFRLEAESIANGGTGTNPSSAIRVNGHTNAIGVGIVPSTSDTFQIGKNTYISADGVSDDPEVPLNVNGAAVAQRHIVNHTDTNPIFTGLEIRNAVNVVDPSATSLACVNTGVPGDSFTIVNASGSYTSTVTALVPAVLRSTASALTQYQTETWVCYKANEWVMTS